MPNRNARKDWFQSVSEGEIPGYSTMEKFGENPDIDTGTSPEDVWDGGDLAGAGIYTFSTTADIDSVSSSNAGDTQDITIIGLDANWAEVTQTVTLNGQIRVALTTSLIRVYRAYNANSTNFAGNVSVYVNTALTAGVPTDVTKIRAYVRIGNNQTLMCIYTIPAGKTGYFWGGYVSYAKSNATGATFTWRARAFGGVFQVKSKLTCIGTGSSSWDYTYKFPLALPEKTDVLIRCDEVESNNTGVSGGFTVLLKDD